MHRPSKSVEYHLREKRGGSQSTICDGGDWRLAVLFEGLVSRVLVVADRGRSDPPLAICDKVVEHASLPVSLWGRGWRSVVAARVARWLLR